VNSETRAGGCSPRALGRRGQKVESEEPLSTAERLELEELRRRNAELEKDLEVPRRAAAIFARNRRRHTSAG